MGACQTVGSAASGVCLVLTATGKFESSRVPYWRVLEDVIADCPACGESFALGVDTAAESEQSTIVVCPTCHRSLEVFVRCRPGEILSTSVSAD